MGFGDEIMATAEARELKCNHPDAAVVVGHPGCEFWSEIFANNPNITRLAEVPSGQDIVWLRNYFGNRPYLNYAHANAEERQLFRAYRARRGDLYFDDQERAFAAAATTRTMGDALPIISVEPHVDFGPNKDWGFARWQEVVDRFAGRARFLQPDYGKRLLEGIEPVRGSFRQYAAALARCSLHVGPEGGLHHAAAAVRTPAVVVFGGRISPAITGYDDHENLFADIDGSPCGMIAACQHCRTALTSISVEDVAAAMRRLLPALDGTRMPFDGGDGHRRRVREVGSDRLARQQRCGTVGDSGE